MVLITRHNYEAFLLDYIEGNLSEQDTAGIMRFLNQNPDLKKELDDFDLITLTDDSSNFEGKEDLKIQAEIDELLIGKIEKVNTADDTARLSALLLAFPQFKKDEKVYAATILEKESIDFGGKSDIKLQTEIDELLIGRIEKLNTAADEARLSSLLIANPQFQKDEKAFAVTVLKQESISYPYKSDLKQETRLVPIYFWYSAAAACVIGFMATFGFNNTTSDDLQYASNSINISTPSLAIEKLPDFNILTGAEDIDTTSADAINETFTPPFTIDDLNIASSGKKPEKVPNKKDNNSDSTNINSPDIKFIPPSIDIIPSDEIAVIDTVSSVMDSILNSTSPIDPISTESDNIAMTSSNEPHSLGEFITYKTREKVFGEEEPTYNAIQTNEVLSNVAKGVDKVTASKVSFNQEQTDQGKSTRLKIGKFELYRSAR